MLLKSQHPIRRHGALPGFYHPRSLSAVSFSLGFLLCFFVEQALGFDSLILWLSISFGSSIHHYLVETLFDLISARKLEIQMHTTHKIVSCSFLFSFPARAPYRVSKVNELNALMCCIFE